MDPARSADQPDSVLIRLAVDPLQNAEIVRALSLDLLPPVRRLLRLYERGPGVPGRLQDHGVALLGRRRPGEAQRVTVTVGPLRPSLVPVAAAFRADGDGALALFAEWDGRARMLVARLTAGRAPPPERGGAPGGTLLSERQHDFLRLLARVDLTGDRLAVRALTELTWPVEIGGLAVRVRCRRQDPRGRPPRAGSYEVRLRAGPREAPLLLPALTAQLALRGVDTR